jgi:hypothetical protein
MNARIPALALALLALAGCESNSEARERRDSCIHEARNAAEARVVIRYYRQGKLGPKDEIRRSLEGVRYDDGKRPRIFDERGRMLPWEKMDKPGQSTILDWMNNNPKIESITTPEREAVLERLKPDCD